MKRKATLLLLCMTTCCLVQAKIWRVNNISGVQADFTTLQAAHDGAASGDTLHIEGSATTYSGITINKKLTIIGPGYFLGENPGNQAWVQSAKLGTLTFYVGSAGSSVTGIDFQFGNVEIYANDIVVRKNKFTSSGNGQIDWQTNRIATHYQSNNGNVPVSDIIITQNYGVSILIANPSSSILVIGNYIAGNGYNGGDNNQEVVFNMHANATAIIQNNIFRRGRIVAYNSSITNNIQYSGTMEGTANLMSNNISNSTQFPNTNGNKQNVDMASVFLLDGVSPDAQWKLKANSPAIGAGYGSTTAKRVDAGMYSGNTPYVVSGMPSMPAIYFFENQPVGSSSDPIDVTIKVRSAGN